MIGLLLNFLRRRKVRKFASDIPTGFIPLASIKTANVVIDVEEPGFDKLKEDIIAWGKNAGIKLNLYFFDFRRLGKDELLLTSITNTILKKELDILGTPDPSKVAPLLEEESDIFISMIDNAEFPIRFLAYCTKARFKIGRHEFEEHPYNMIMSGNETTDLRSEAREIFAGITDFMTKIS